MAELGDVCERCGDPVADQKSIVVEGLLFHLACHRDGKKQLALAMQKASAVFTDEDRCREQAGRFGF